MKQIKNAPVQKNDAITLSIDTLTSEGAGVGRMNGYTVFVNGALPGETVQAHVIKVTSTYAVAKVTEVLIASPSRTQPRCPVFNQCGGCTLQHLSYPAQLATKQQQVLDALTRLGGFTDIPMHDICGMEEPWHYRNKGSFPFGTAGGGAVFGFFAERSHRLVPFADCPIQDKRIVEIAQKVCAWANEHDISVYNEETHAGSLRHVMARATATGETMAVIVTNGPLKQADALISALDGINSIWHNENSRDTNAIFGQFFTHLAGQPTLTECIGDNRFSVSPQSFLQVNAVQTSLLYGFAVQFLNPQPTETVVDAYCGIGTISLLLAERCARVIGIEQVPEAIADAKKNAAENHIQNASFLCGAVEAILPELFINDQMPNAVVLDPPRKGCEETALAAICKAGISRLVYVSCNPSTLARDLKYLSAHGYVLQAVQPVDMFPHTSHVETVVLMSKVR
ncbi:MAG: 23S rRNA (uracil(1939)-C(5))-methyltransferase RlmD [Clostridia bacterium]